MVEVWADAFGNWYAKVPNSMSDDRRVVRNTAHRAISRELQDRDHGFDPNNLKVKLVTVTDEDSVFTEVW